ncbi:MAG: 2'-5' RNA ligase family protein [Planctomycetaceae bacterium]|nr:2'-5' RNA ligase family protein [Planctomycetaceae bacterium]
MEEQLSLLEPPIPLPKKYRLFLGIFPDAEAVDLICDRQTILRHEFGLRGKSRPREILHMTLHHVADYSEMPEREIKVIEEACTAAFAGQSSLEMIFDHVKSFKGRPGNQPFVLVNPNENQPLMELHHRLIIELAKRKLASKGDFNFVPHVTLLYDSKSVTEQPVAPITWRAHEVVLVLSHLGETRYDRIGSWTLSE